MMTKKRFDESETKDERLKRRKELLEADQYETLFRLCGKMGVKDDE